MYMKTTYLLIGKRNLVLCNIFCVCFTGFCWWFVGSIHLSLNVFFGRNVETGVHAELVFLIAPAPLRSEIYP
jgi:hypothetical protein